jgi:integrase
MTRPALEAVLRDVKLFGHGGAGALLFGFSYRRGCFIHHASLARLCGCFSGLRGPCYHRALRFHPARDYRATRPATKHPTLDSLPEPTTRLRASKRVLEASWSHFSLVYTSARYYCYVRLLYFPT